MKLSGGTDFEPVRGYWGTVPVSERTGCKVLDAARNCRQSENTEGNRSGNFLDRCRPAAHEVDDLVAVVRGNLCIGPFCARQNVEVALHGHAIQRHCKVLEQ